MKEEIIIVDENDQIIGHKVRGTLDQKDVYRVSALWVQNSNGHVLLAKRALTKKHSLENGALQWPAPMPKERLTNQTS